MDISNLRSGDIIYSTQVMFFCRYNEHLCQDSCFEPDFTTKIINSLDKTMSSERHPNFIKNESME